jgi:hypothetical protein
VEEERERVKELVRQAFSDTPRPENSALSDSHEGDEPFLVEAEFRDKQDWRSIEPSFLDQSPEGLGSALSFLSRAAFRYFVPAYLLADLDEKLEHADPLFHLWHGLDDETRREKVNPGRYGDRTWFEAVSARFALFARDEIEAIVAYLEYKAISDEFSRPKITQALANYWRPRLRAE